jgi:hypothetical protein
MRKFLAAVALVALLAPSPANAWWEKGHRLVGQIAWDHLTPVARQNVRAILGVETMADVASWADVYRPLVAQTTGWHFVDIPGDKQTYQRDRDCPTQPGVKLGSYNDKWRDCATDRILFFESRIADPKVDPIERAESLEFLIHVVGDIHQPLHATGVEQGGNFIDVTAFGSPACSTSGKCNLHNIWDGHLIEHRNLHDPEYLDMLEAEIKSKQLAAGSLDPVVWTNESKVIADAIMVPKGADIDEAYYQKNIVVINHQLELAGLRLAAVLNGTFTAPPTPFKPAPIDPKDVFHERQEQ